jgi:hypothetical protein
MEAPADLGPQVDPQTIQIGKEYYWLAPGSGYKKGTITRRRDGMAMDAPYFWLSFQRSGEIYPNTLGINPANPSFYHKFYKVRDFVAEAQKNALRNLGVRGRVPMDIAMHELPQYLGLGGRSKRKHRKIRRRTRSSKK